MNLKGNRLPTDVIREITMIRRLAPATRKIRQRRLEANMGLIAGTLSELCLTGTPSRKEPAPSVAKKPPVAKKAPPKKKKSTTKKKAKKS